MSRISCISFTLHAYGLFTFEAWRSACRNLGSHAIHGFRVSIYLPINLIARLNMSIVRGYLESCRSIVGATKNIAKMIKAEIPELYVLGNPPASVVAFASKHPKVQAHEVGDRMSKKGWHLSAIVNPDACHIAVTVSLLPGSCSLPVTDGDVRIHRSASLSLSSTRSSLI